VDENDRHNNYADGLKADQHAVNAGLGQLFEHTLTCDRCGQLAPPRE
jgi:hypothetical protein